MPSSPSAKGVPSAGNDPAVAPPTTIPREDTVIDLGPETGSGTSSEATEYSVVELEPEATTTADEAKADSAIDLELESDEEATARPKSVSNSRDLEPETDVFEEDARDCDGSRSTSRGSGNDEESPVKFSAISEVYCEKDGTSMSSGAETHGPGLGAAIVDILDGQTDSDYEFQEVVDPDLLSRDSERTGGISTFVDAVNFITRGHAIPWKALAIIVAYSTFVVTVTFFAAKDWTKNTPENCTSRWWCSQVSVDPDIIGYVGFALFLLLAFRVNDSYGRWAEGIRIWNDDIAGTISAFCTYFTYSFRRGLFHENDRERVLGLTAAFAVALKRSLRGETDLRELESFLSKADIKSIQRSPDMAGHCLYLLNGYVISAMHIKELNLPGPYFNMLLGHLQTLAGLQGMCMRIKTYKVAYGYQGHLKVFLGIWFFLLPLSLVETSGWLTILWISFIAYGILGMHSAAGELADPFGYEYNDIRLGIITSAIKKDIRGIYKKSLTASIVVRGSVPDMLNVPEEEGGRLSNDHKKKK